MKYYLVDISTLTVTTDNTFNKALIEAYASQLVQVGNVLKPLIVKPTGIDQYEVITGQKEYFAAKRAKELNPRFETVSAWVIEKTDDLTAILQLNDF